MRTCLSCLFLLLATETFCATWTDPGTGLTWTYTIEDGRAKLGGNQNPSALPVNTGGTIVIPDKLGGCNVEEVGYKSFCFTENVGATIVFPSSVNKIHRGAVLGEVISWGNSGVMYYIASKYGVNKYVFRGNMPVVDESKVRYEGYDVWVYSTDNSYGTSICGMMKNAMVYSLKEKGWTSTFLGGNVSLKEGFVDDPLINSVSQAAFDHSNYCVVLTCGTSDAVIRYTTDGSEVTKNSQVYEEGIRISETTIIKAKAYKANWLDSEEAVQIFTRLWYTNETPVIEAAASAFSTASQEVTLSCATDGATIYYTMDGSVPSAANGRVYTGPFNIYQTTTVKAIAVKDDWKDSAVATATFTKSNTLGPAMNLLEMLPDNDASHPWTVVTDVTHDGVSAVRSGTITHEQSTTLKTVVYGAGRLSFWWKTACEPSVDGEYYDYATFYNGSTAVTNLAGVTDWQQVMLRVDGTGKHTFKWTYQKDDSGTTPSDCVWVDQVQWLPDTTDYYSDHTLTTETPVPYAWLEHYGYGTKTDYESAANSTLGKRDSNKRLLRVEDDYVAGTDPTNITSVFTTDISMENGFPEITWWPDLNEGGTKSFRKYKIWGKAALGDGSDWEYPTNTLHRFFKVSVEMP